MKLATAEEMRLIDRETIGQYGIPSAVLMERAGLAVAEKVKAHYPREKIVVLCGSGNNGGDGLVAARNLHAEGHRVTVHMVVHRESLSDECSAQLRIAESFGVPIVFAADLAAADLHGSVVLDAMFGTGLSKPLTGALSALVRLVNDVGVPIISVDISSGVSADTGEILGAAIRATQTVTFGLPKRGHVLRPGADYTGRLSVADIGFPPALMHDRRIAVEMVTAERGSLLLPARPAHAYKNMFGHVFVVAGSTGKTGAALMTAKACLRAGAGVVTIGVPETLIDVFMCRVTEEMLLPLPDTGSGTLAAFAADEILRQSPGRFDVLAVGPGLGASQDLHAIMRELILCSSVPMVIDADGLNSIAGQSGVLHKAKAPLVLTPHPGELRRLDPNIPADMSRIDSAMKFASSHGVCLVAKGAPTITAKPDGQAFVNTTGNAGMATAGAGDVLTGIIAGLVAQKMEPARAAILGVYLHGLAGDIAVGGCGQHSLIATDLISALPDAFLALRKNDASDS
ncbi:MAG TPA: NAD(P)H-hydrate dehydratase [Dissulfurispiraceae bacterium]|nr:NAD(P)H-hydrate dehydratase [Dissulfurispiraceae bacterium]